MKTSLQLSLLMPLHIVVAWWICSEKPWRYRSRFEKSALEIQETNSPVIDTIRKRGKVF